MIQTRNPAWTALLALLVATTALVTVAQARSLEGVPDILDDGLPEEEGRYEDPPGAEVDDGNVESAPETTQPTTCVTQYAHVEGLGLACLTEIGLWRVLLADGTTLTTHGLDAAPEGADPSSPLDVDIALPLGDVEAAGSNMPRCATSTESRWRAVWAYDSSVTSPSYSTDAKTIRTRVNETNYIFDTRAHGSSYHHEFQFLCLDSTRITVSSIGKVTCSGSCDMGEVVNKLKTYSWGKDSNTNYLIFFRGNYAGAGNGGVEGDKSDSSSNTNNFGPQYSVMDNCCWHNYAGGGTLHEMGHNMGTVQHSAPSASGGWHCNDGLSYMCYSDGGSTSDYKSTVCSSVLWDCNKNNYCDNKPTSGEWLDKNWNPCLAYYNFAYKTAM